MSILFNGIRWLSPQDGDDAFPPASDALCEPDGLLAAGGDLRPERLLAAYTRGIFPMFDDDRLILWWSPDPRTVLRPADLHVSRRLARTLRKTDLRFSADTAFDAVIRGCAAPREQSTGTWITSNMIEAYGRLHDMGWAHAFEGWIGDDLVAGMYGVATGRVFFAESMFTRVDNASKAVLVNAVRFLQDRSFELIDCQMWSDHMGTLGATSLPRHEFLEQLERWRAPRGEPGNWRCDHERFAQHEFTHTRS